MKKIFIAGIATLAMASCAEMQQVLQTLPQAANTQGLNGISNTDITSGLKQALNLGVKDGIEKLGQHGGFFKNEMTRILLPEELKVVDKTLRQVGLGSLADQGLKLLNNAAEDAVVTAAPIFTKAIQDMTIYDAKNVLLGGNNAATNYLSNKTTAQLTTAFHPNIQQSLGKVGADKVWKKIITKYNLIAGRSLNTDLSGYVTEQAIGGVFKMVANKEQDIRKNISSRTTSLLQKVFALQDR